MKDNEFMKIYKKCVSDFYDHFHYIPNHPNELNFDVREYSEMLKKCIADRVDYTIEKYGTPAEQMLKKRQPGEMIWD